MPFNVSPGYSPLPTISDNTVNSTPLTQAPPEMKVWEKIKPFFHPAQQTEASECVRTICHPPQGTTREDILNAFDQLRTKAYPGYQENIQSGRYGNSYFCILGASHHEVLSVTFDGTRSYTLECEGDINPRIITITQSQCDEYYESIWSAWELAALPGEESSRATVVQQLCHCLYDKCTTIDLNNLNITTLPDHLPSNIMELKIGKTRLTSLPPVLPPELKVLMVVDTLLTILPTLPSGIHHLNVTNTPLTILPTLPSGLNWLEVNNTQLTSLPALPAGMKYLKVNKTPLVSLPKLPSGIQALEVDSTPLSRLPELPSEIQLLEVSDTPLTIMPTLPSGIRDLQLCNTRLIRLLESIFNLSSQANVYLRNNPLTERFLQRLIYIISAPGYSGAPINFDTPSPIPLHLVVAYWLPPENIDSGRWKDFIQEDNAASFSQFLDSPQSKNENDYAKTAAWLTDLAKDDELRANAFANRSNHKLITLVQNHMEKV